MSINNPNVCATKLHSVCMPLLRVICQCHQFSSILRGVNLSYSLCKTSLCCQFGLNSGGFKRPGALRAYIHSIKFAEFYSKRFLRKLYMFVSHLPLFLLLEFVNIGYVFCIAYLFIFLFFYFFIFLLVCLFAKRTFDMCHPCILRKYIRCASHYILPNTNNLATYQVISTEK